MTVPIGKMRDLVAILRPNKDQDTAGGETRTYTEIDQAMVWIKPLRGREFVQARQVVAEVTHKIIGHFEALKGVTPEFRIRDKNDGREFDVLVPLPSDKRGSVDIFAVQRLNP